jgi:FHS family L-fucose permease-like MFS transporter
MTHGFIDNKHFKDNTMNEVVKASSLSKKQTMASLFIIGMLFFIFGFVSWVNAILIPYFKIACELSHFKAYLVTFAFYISYFVMSVPASYLLKRTGFKKGMMMGFWIMATGAFIFVPAALTRTYEDLFDRTVYDRCGSRCFADRR